MKSVIRTFHRIGQARNPVIVRSYKNWSKYGVKKLKGSGGKPPEPLIILERKTGFGPATPTLARSINPNNYP
jgi:hypothetical protein